MRYVLYARKSTEEDDRQVLSIEAQLHELKEFAAKGKMCYHFTCGLASAEKLAIVKDRATNFLKTMLHFGGLLGACGAAEK